MAVGVGGVFGGGVVGGAGGESMAEFFGVGAVFGAAELHDRLWGRESLGGAAAKFAADGEYVAGVDAADCAGEFLGDRWLWDLAAGADRGWGGVAGGIGTDGWGAIAGGSVAESVAASWFVAG